MRHKSLNETYFALHEVYYDEQGKPDSWTENAKAAFGETPDELIECLEMMLSDAKRCKEDILNYDAPKSQE